MKKNNLRSSITLVTRGCAKNLVDSEKLLGLLYESGYEVRHGEKEFAADIAIINTCGFIGDAKEESVDSILELLQAKKDGFFRKVLVMGCLTQRYREELTKELPDVDGFFGVHEQKELLQSLSPGYRPAGTSNRWLASPGHYAYLKISEGCDRSCSFCAIPGIRGPQQSFPIEALYEEARNLTEKGVKEIILIAQDTTRYGTDIYGKQMLAPLMAQLSDMPDLGWLRLHYAYPKSFPLEVLEIMRDHPKVCRYLDIPLQHINPGLLTSMKRGISRNATLRLLNTFRKEVPGLALRTTFIVGYPGEGEKEFRELYDFVEEQRFDRMGAFTYSPEEGTPAYTLGDTVPEKVKEDRLAALMDLQMGISLQHNQDKIGKTYNVLIDRKEGNCFYGRTEFDSPEVDQEVCIEGAEESLLIGKFYPVIITGAEAYDLNGQLAVSSGQ